MSLWDVRLREAKILVTHANCMDGLASAMLVKDALPSVEVRFVAHNSPEHTGMHAEPGMLFCDFAPHPSNAREFLEAGALVLDHHKYARDVVQQFVELKQGVFADEATEPGVSGAVLAYAYVWDVLCGGPWNENRARRLLLGRGLPNTSAGILALFVGVRDTWQTQSPHWQAARLLHATLAAFPQNYWLERGGLDMALEQSQHLGEGLLAEQAEKVEKLAQGGLVRRYVGGRTWALSTAPYELISDLGEASRRLGVNVLVNMTPIIEEGRLYYSVSLRSDESVDVGKVAKQRGGGGHSAAAGFRMSQDASIIETFGLLVDDVVKSWQ